MVPPRQSSAPTSTRYEPVKRPAEMSSDPNREVRSLRVRVSDPASIVSSPSTATEPTTTSSSTVIVVPEAAHATSDGPGTLPVDQLVGSVQDPAPGAAHVALQSCGSIGRHAASPATTATPARTRRANDRPPRRGIEGADAPESTSVVRSD